MISVCVRGYPNLLMRATNFEFRYRFFVLAVVFFLGFGVRFDRFQMIAAESLANVSGRPTQLRTQCFIGLGALIIGLAAAIRTWATAYLNGEVVHDMALHSDRVVADGPYRYVRNPLYLGTILLTVGIGLLAPVPNWILMVAAGTLFNYRLILREEDALTASQSEDYLRFKRAVPRLIPSLTPRLPASGRAPAWSQAWRAESFFWAFAIGQLFFAFTLSRQLLLTSIFGALIVYAIAHVVNSQRQKRRVA